jgi:midasin (ATPase involved in ribosome maturation)
MQLPVESGAAACNSAICNDNPQNERKEVTARKASKVSYSFSIRILSVYSEFRITRGVKRSSRNSLSNPTRLASHV